MACVLHGYVWHGVWHTRCVHKRCAQRRQRIRISPPPAPSFPADPPPMSVALLVLPDFLLVALGWLLYRHLRYTRDFFAGLEKLVYYVLLPALLIRAILSTPLTFAAASELLAATALVMAAGLALAWAARFIIKSDAVTLASGSQCAYRFNTYLGLALAASLAGPSGQAVMAVILGFGVPLGNVAAVCSLARERGGVCAELARNPLLVSTLAALAGNFAGLTLPVPVDIVLARLGSAALALGILCVGAGLIWRGGRRAAPLLAWLLAVKLLALPALALAVGHALGLAPLARNMLFLFATLPAASSAYILTVRMGGDAPTVAQLISLGTVLSAVTIPLWLLWLG